MSPCELRNKVHFGDSYALMKTWPDSFLDCTVTSPPYWMQRSYLPDGHKLKLFEMGSEQSLESYVAGMADLFGELYRLTRPGGTLWLNIGDKVAGSDTRAGAPGYRDGELIGIPWLVSSALRSKGWHRRAEVIWSKPNPMTSGRNRAPVTSHEHVFLFTKGDGYYDPVAASDACKYPNKRKGEDVRGDTRKPRSVWEIPVGRSLAKALLADIREDGKYLEVSEDCPIHGKNPTVSPGPLFGDGPDVECSCVPVAIEHFAVMPPKLAEKCILLGSSEAGIDPSTNRPWVRVVSKERVATRPGIGATIDQSGKSNRDPLRHVTRVETLGWAGPEFGPMLPPVPSLVFDPFCGEGTVPAVAKALGRDYIAIDLNPAYAKKLAPARIEAGYERTYKAS